MLCMINNLRAARSEQVCGLKLIEGQAISEYPRGHGAPHPRRDCKTLLIRPSPVLTPVRPSDASSSSLVFP